MTRITVTLVIVTILIVCYSAIVNMNNNMGEIKNESHLVGYLDELELYKNSTLIYNGTDAGEVIQWALDSLNSSGIVYIKNGFYCVNVTRYKE